MISNSSLIFQARPQSLRPPQFPTLRDTHARVVSSSPSSPSIVRMSATGYSGISLESLAVKPPSHPTYDLKGVIKLALAEDAADRGLWSLPFDSLSYPFQWVR